MSRGMQYTGSVAAVSSKFFMCENAASILFNVYCQVMGRVGIRGSF